MIEVIVEQICNGCEKSDTKIKKRDKGKKYCSTCYARIFKKSICPKCGLYARLNKNDDKAICNECIKKQPCIRCNIKNKPIGKLTEYGVVCNSCSVYFRLIERCERCETPSQKLSRISRFNDDLRVCPKCSTRDYETCPLCHKYRLLEVSINGDKVCKKCKTNANKSCLECENIISAGCADLCSDCYWHKNLWAKFNRNIHLFESSFLKKQYENYINWLGKQVGEHKASLYLNKHTQFFIKTEMLWSNSVPNNAQLLSVLRTKGLRKFELITQWLDQKYGVQISSVDKSECSESDQVIKLIGELPQPSLAFDIVSAYKLKLDEKMNRGMTTSRSIRLAIKPAVALMLTVGHENKVLPDLKSIQIYLAKYSGQTAALTGFINFLNDQYSTDIDFNLLKKSNFIKNINQKKLEQDLLKILSSKQDIDVVLWVRKSLQYFHNVGIRDAFAVKPNMIVEVQDGYEVSYKNNVYWLPKSINLRKDQIH